MTNQKENMENISRSEFTTPPEQSVRKALPSEAGLICEILADAFSQDPVMRWMNDQPETYLSMFRCAALSLYLKHEHVFINQSGTGAAMWAPPGVSSNSPIHWTLLPMLWNMFKNGGFGSIKRGSALEAMFTKNHIKEPHYYLHTIGTVLGEQGKGVGSALLQAGVKLCDENQSLAFLESSNIRNNPLYERFGFKVTGELQLPDDGPTVWTMLREPI